MQFDRGFLSPHFVTDQKTLEAELKDAYILIHEDKISNVKKLIPLLEATSRANKPLLIIAEDVEGEALATLVVNKLRGIVNCVAVKAPGYGDRRKAMLEDIAILTGAEAVFKDLGGELEKVTLKHLGRAKKVTVDSRHDDDRRGRRQGRPTSAGASSRSAARSRRPTATTTRRSSRSASRSSPAASRRSTSARRPRPR